MMKTLKTLALAVSALASITSHADDIIHKQYDGYAVTIDCNMRAPIFYHAHESKDTGNAPRINTFKLDPSVPKRCQQTSTRTYKGGYDRGHQMSFNSQDYSQEAAKQSMYMTNVLPQTKQLNRGSMLESEMLQECYRDLSGGVDVYGGIFPKEAPINKQFLSSHGVTTPAYYWKVIVRPEADRAIAFIMPNDRKPTRKNLDKYIVSIADIEKRLGHKIPGLNVPYDLEHKVSHGWAMPYHCNLT